jgi:hypothetical protein
MPEAAMDKNSCPEAGEHDVRPADESQNVEPIAKSKAVQEPSDNQLRASITASDRPHTSSALVRGQIVRHRVLATHSRLVTSVGSPLSLSSRVRVSGSEDTQMRTALLSDADSLHRSILQA